MVFAFLELDLLDAMLELERAEAALVTDGDPYDSAVVYMAADLFEDRLGFGFEDLEEPDLDRLIDGDFVISSAWADCVDSAQVMLTPDLRAC